MASPVPTSGAPTCDVCTSDIDDNKFIRCFKKKCGKYFHTECVHINPKEPENKWVCPECIPAPKKAVDNSAAAPTRPNRSMNSTTRKPRPTNTTADDLPPSDAVSSPLTNLTEEIKLLRGVVTSMKAEFNTVVATLCRCEERIEEMSATIISHESRLKVAEETTAKVAELEKANATLQAQVSHLSQVRLENEVEVSGIPEMPNENLYSVALTIATAAGSNISESDIEYVNRAGPPRNSNNSSARPLVIRFCRRVTRDNFYKSARARRLSTQDINVEGPSRKIYLGERLTTGNRYLFRECRERSKQAGFKFCWTKRGTIFVKKEEGAQATAIRSLDDIDRILGEQRENPNLGQTDSEST